MIYRNRDVAIQAHNNALNDVTALHRALRIVRVFYIYFHARKNETAKKLLRELGTTLVTVSERAKARHQEASEQI